jgi:hypothetical protein
LRGKTPCKEFDRRRRLRYEDSLIVAGEGNLCFLNDPGLRCVTVPHPIEELEAPPTQMRVEVKLLPVDIKFERQGQRYVTHLKANVHVLP